MLRPGLGPASVRELQLFEDLCKEALLTELPRLRLLIIARLQTHASKGKNLQLTFWRWSCNEFGWFHFDESRKVFQPRRRLSKSKSKSEKGFPSKQRKRESSFGEIPTKVQRSLSRTRCKFFCCCRPPAFCENFATGFADMFCKKILPWDDRISRLLSSP